MIKNFETIKKQLEEIAPTINSFKSEAVQLKVVELIFEAASTEEADEEKEAAEKNDGSAKVKNPVKRKPSSKKNAGSTTKATSKKPAQTATSLLTQMIDNQYFKAPKSISEIQKYLKDKKGASFKTSELSTPLKRLVASSKLDRDKNEETGAYEYKTA